MNGSELPNTQVLTIVGYDDDAEVDRDRDRGFLKKQLVRRVVDVDQLEHEVKSFLAAMERIIGKLDQQVGKYQMDSITVSAEVNAHGKVSLLGSGGEIGAKGGMSFTFKRAAGS